MTHKSIIGLTGGIGSGKSAAAKHFSDHGVSVVDADQASREVVKKGEPALSSISDYFGEKIIPQLKTCSLPKEYNRIPPGLPDTPLGVGERK